METGYSAPFVRIYYKDRELAYVVEKFRYVYDEENPDECSLSIRSDDPNILDEPELQAGAELKVVWGYIGGNSVSRKVYIQDIEPTMDKEGLNLELKCTDKAIELRRSNSHKLHKNGDALGVAASMGNKHGLSIYIEYGPGNTADLSKLIGELKDPKKKRDKRNPTLLERALGPFLFKKDSQDFDKSIDNFSRAAAKDFQESTYFLEEYLGFNRGIAPTRLLLNNYNDFVKNLNAYRQQGRMPPESFFRDNPYYTELYLKSLKSKLGQEYGENSPQAGRSDFQILNDKLKSMDGEPYVTDTRDDEVVIRRRNFNQAPYKAYTYKGDIGDLLSFTPITKTKTKSSTNSAVGYGSWDPKTKSFDSSKVDGSTSASPTNLTGFSSGEPNKIIVPQVSMGREIGTGTPSISTQVLKGLTIKKFSTESDDQYVKNLYGPRGNSNSAQNIRDDSELKYNPGKALLHGDPNIKVGQVLTFLNVSKKYSGNYYLVKSTHDLDSNGGYYTSVELTRQGVNLRGDKLNRISSKDTNKQINKQLGVDNSSVRKRLKIQRNKR